MNEKLIAASRKFWEYLEKADVAGMESIADPACNFAQIGVT